ncbi:MAG: hypothetical protein R3A44_44530 [Caldilineaceae bacterium]
MVTQNKKTRPDNGASLARGSTHFACALEISQRQATWKPVTRLNRNGILGQNQPLGRSLSGGFQKDACGNSQSVISTSWKAWRFLLVLINALVNIA